MSERTVYRAYSYVGLAGVIAQTCLCTNAALLSSEYI